MKKAFLILSLILILVVAFAACDGSETPNGPNDPEHTHAYGEWETTKEASCLEEGMRIRRCACLEQESETIPATGHAFGEWTTTQELTCTADGTKERVCACGEKESETIPTDGTAHNYSNNWTSDDENHWHACQNKGCTSVSDKATHTFSNWMETKAPTCTEDGIKERACSCGKRESETIPTDGTAHNYSITWTTDGTNHWHKCQNRGCTSVSDNATHTFGEWIVDTAATCMKSGRRHHVCTVCGKSVSEIYSDPNAHNYATTWTADDTNHWHKCQNSGCTSISAEAPHTWDKENTCTTCQRYKDTGVEFMKKVDGTYKVSDYTGSASEVIIPSTYYGIAVTSIGYGAFSECKSLTSIIISNSVTTVDERAFYGCENLTSINIPDNVTTIGKRAFYGCENLTSINIPNGVTTIGDYTFYGCDSLARITIADSVTTIGDNAFYNCTNLTSVTFGENGQLTTIGDYAFYGCESLARIIIPNSVTNIGKYVFQRCESLASINIPDGVTVIGDYTFYGCESLASINIPNSVTSIGKNAFHGCDDLESVAFSKNCQLTKIGKYVFQSCTSLTSITIPEGVTTIDDGAFWGCTNLASVIIPGSVTTIGDYAFWGCTSFNRITFEGTKDGWHEINKGDYWHFSTISITVKCAGGTVTEY